MPDLFEWLPIGSDTADFSISLSFDGHPSGSFSFIALAEDRLLIEATMRLGSELEAFGIAWRVTSLSFAEAPSLEQPVRIVAVNVSLGGKYENYLDKKASFNSAKTPSTKELETNCEDKITEENSKPVVKPTSATVQELASRVGTTFNGSGDWRFDIPVDTPIFEGFGLGDKISELEITNASFPVYSDPKGIITKDPNAVRVWNIDETSVVSPVTLTVSGIRPSNPTQLTKVPKQLGFKVLNTGLPGAKLSPRTLPIQIEPPPVLVNYFYPAFKFEGEVVQEDDLKSSSNTPEEKVKGDEVRWARVPPFTITLDTGDVNASTRPGSPSGDINNNFDQSGPQKVLKRTTYVDGVEVRSTTEIYGWIIRGVDAVYWDGSKWVKNSNSGRWAKVKEYRTNHSFEGKYGYHVGSTTTGFEMVRFRQEASDIPETAIAASLLTRELTEENIAPLFKSVSPSEVMELPENNIKTFINGIVELYRFTTVSVIEEEIKSLIPESEIYEDLVEETNANTEQVCLPNGKVEERPKESEVIEDPGYAPPYLVMSRDVSKGAFSVRLNPEFLAQNNINQVLNLDAEERNDKFVPAYLSTGSIKSEEMSISIGSTKPGRESFTVYNSVYSSQGPEFRSKLQQATYENKLGRPESASTRLATIFERIEELDDKGSKKEISESNPPSDFASGFDFFIESVVDAPKTTLLGGTLNYPYCKTEAQILKAAKYDLWKQNITGLGTKSFSIVYNDEHALIREGDRIDLTVNNVVGKYRVTGISYTLTVRGKKLVTCDGINLTVVPEPVIDITIRREKKPQPATANRNPTKGTRGVLTR
jgi:hypothetical protein